MSNAPAAVAEDDGDDSPQAWCCLGSSVEEVARNLERHVRAAEKRIRAELKGAGAPDEMIERAIALIWKDHSARWDAAAFAKLARDLADSRAATIGILRALGFTVTTEAGAVTLRSGSTERKFSALHEALTWGTRGR